MSLSTLLGDAVAAVRDYAPRLVAGLTRPSPVDAFDLLGDRWPLADFYAPLVMSFVYLAVLAALYEFMRGRRAFDLRYVVAAHNALLCVVSAIMVAGCVRAVLRLHAAGHGVWDYTCDPAGIVQHSTLAVWVYIFYLTKFLEYGDTFLLVLRKRHVGFLHVYHHTVTALVVFYIAWTRMSMAWLMVITNATVHVFMYFYYFLASLGVRSWWKRYLTIGQIAQFWFNIIMLCTWCALVAAGYGCSGRWYGMAQGLFVNVSFYVLFKAFYEDTYRERLLGKRPAQGATAAAKAKVAKAAVSVDSASDSDSDESESDGESDSDDASDDESSDGGGSASPPRTPPLRRRGMAPKTPRSLARRLQIDGFDMTPSSRWRAARR